jgi:hypothetical protein
MCVETLILNHKRYFLRSENWNRYAQIVPHLYGWSSGYDVATLFPIFKLCKIVDLRFFTSKIITFI